jgi:hypothetical protein
MPILLSWCRSEVYDAIDMVEPSDTLVEANEAVSALKQLKVVGSMASFTSVAPSNSNGSLDNAPPSEGETNDAPAAVAEAQDAVMQLAERDAELAALKKVQVEMQKRVHQIAEELQARLTLLGNQVSRRLIALPAASLVLIA